MKFPMEDDPRRNERMFLLLFEGMDTITMKAFFNGTYQHTSVACIQECNHSPLSVMQEKHWLCETISVLSLFKIGTQQFSIMDH